jgi:hypothetical protein
MLGVVPNPELIVGIVPDHAALLPPINVKPVPKVNPPTDCKLIPPVPPITKELVPPIVIFEFVVIAPTESGYPFVLTAPVPPLTESEGLETLFIT